MNGGYLETHNFKNFRMFRFYARKKHNVVYTSKINAGGMNIIQLILKISKLPLQYPTEESCSPVSFSFWYSLQDSLILYYIRNCFYFCVPVIFFVNID